MNLHLILSLSLSMFAGYCQNLDELLPTLHHDSPTVVPKFVSRGHLYKAIVGDTIELPCKVQNLGNENTEKRMHNWKMHFTCSWIGAFRKIDYAICECQATSSGRTNHKYFIIFVFGSKTTIKYLLWK